MPSKGQFWIAMAFNENDEPVVGHVGQGQGIRMYTELKQAKTQRKRWLNGTKFSHNSSHVYHKYPCSKVFECTYVAGVLMTREVDCDELHPK